MTTSDIKHALNRDYVSSKDKLEAFKKFYRELNAIEIKAARDFALPLSEILEVKKLLPLILSTINRLEAGAARTRRNSELKP